MSFRRKTTCYNLLLLAIVASMSFRCDTGRKKNDFTAKQKTGTNLVHIHNTWILTTIKGKALTADIQKIPTLEIRVEEKKFHGNDGCNSIFGNLKVLTHTDLQFGAIASTKMMCRDIMKITGEYIPLLKQVRHYTIEGNHLYLKDADAANVLVYKKKKGF